MDSNNFLDEEQRNAVYPVDYDPSLIGIGGWLVLIILGQFLNIILCIKNIIDSRSYIGKNAEFGLLFIVAIAVCILSVVLSAGILFFIFKTNITFRILFVIQGLLNLVFVIFIASYIDGLGYNNGYLISSIVGSLIGNVIWITYVFKSKRVKNTFIYSRIYKKPENEGYRL
jgi:hypothetical protein